MRLALVTMPWQTLDVPSLPLGILSEVVRRRRPRDEVRTWYANITWAGHVLEQTGGEVTPDDYADLVEDGLFHGLGDWVFTSALYPRATWPVERYEAHPATRKVHDAPARRMRELAPAFIAALADTVLAWGPDLVGLTSTFMQNVPSLALAAELKRRDPSIRVVLGGGNCEGPMGAALHRNFDVLDYVVRGEGELTFVELLNAIDQEGDATALERISGLCWRRGGECVANPVTADALGMDEVPTPDFDEFFAAIEAAGPVREYVQPKLVNEAARGCWWGERQHCTFCGLNGSTLKFRSKPAERVASEIEEQVRRHRTLDVVMVDNIMDMSYIGSLLPRLAATDWDLRVHYEVKSNLRHEHVRQMAAAGVVDIQPGIESLSTNVLKLMRKGVDGVTNVRLLRDCEELNVTSSWNLLYGFPGEEPADYVAMLAQMSNLHHLQPPRNATRIALERFSPYQVTPGLGFGFRKPAAFYDHVYDLAEAELMDLVFVFDSEPAGITGDLERAVIEAADQWQDAYRTSTLTWKQVGAELIISDRRRSDEPRDHVLRVAWQVTGYRLLADGRGARGLADALGSLEVPSPSPDELRGWLEQLQSQGLVFSDAGRCVALATSGVAARLPIDRWR